MELGPGKGAHPGRARVLAVDAPDDDDLAELALALPVEPLPCGLDRHAGLGAWPGIDVPQIGDAEIRPSGREGLGVGTMEELM